MRKHWRVLRHGEDFVLSRYEESEASVSYERKALRMASEAGWPVPLPVDEPIVVEGGLWSLARFLPGEPPSGDDEPSRRGRLLAEFHESLSGQTTLGPRPGFRRAERALDDSVIERTLKERESRHREEASIIRWHLERARKRLQGIDLASMAGRPIHGDFSPWNLGFSGDRLTAILDFEMAREDHRMAEFIHAWRGKYDTVVHAYNEVLPLEPVEWAILTPIWWLFLVDLWCGSAPDDAWILAKLRERSPLMGPDRDALP